MEVFEVKNLTNSSFSAILHKDISGVKFSDEIS